jgi:hypothetical protein
LDPENSRSKRKRKTQQESERCVQKTERRWEEKLITWETGMMEAGI